MKEKLFTPYQVFVIAIISILQFTVIVDFMVISPLGVILMKELAIQTQDFGLVVSAYAFSAGASGLLAAGFADRFDRKKLLLFFYAGFLLGTALCAMATTFPMLLVARVVTGLFGGVIGSVGFAIITDLFPMEVRGRVMGYVQMSFSAAQVLGIPLGLMLANNLGWHSCFWMIAIFGAVVGAVIVARLQPITAHLRLQHDRNAFAHLFHTVSKPRYIFGFATMSFLATGGFMLMPFGSAFSTHNMGIGLDQLPTLYLITGLCSIVMGPVAGKIADKTGKVAMFTVSSILCMVVIAIFTSLGLTPFWLAIVMNVVLFALITSRSIPASALLTAIPQPQDRGAFMSVNSATMQISGGVASVLAGMIVSQDAAGRIVHYDTLGYIVIGSMLLNVIMMYYIDRWISSEPVIPQPIEGARMATIAEPEAALPLAEF